MTSTEAAPPAVTLAQMICDGLWINQALYVAATLGVADELVDGPKTPAALAARTGATVDGLHRVLRALASVGVFAETIDGTYRLTPLAGPLRSGVPGSLRAMAILWGHPAHLSAWSRILDTVKTGVDAFQLAYGMPVFQWLASNPAIAAVFDEAMTSFSGLEAQAIAEAYDFRNSGTIVDIGGGQGLLLATILARTPGVRGIAFDLPHIAERAATTFRAMGVADRVTVESGDFFERVPTGDVYLLKNIIHDWDDPAATRILSAIRGAMARGGRVLVCQEVLPRGNRPSAGKLLDMQMLLIGGRERTEHEYRSLLGASGLQLTQIVPTAGPLHVLEAIAV